MHVLISGLTLSHFIVFSFGRNAVYQLLGIQLPYFFFFIYILTIRCIANLKGGVVLQFSLCFPFSDTSSHMPFPFRTVLLVKHIPVWQLVCAQEPHLVYKPCTQELQALSLNSCSLKPINLTPNFRSLRAPQSLGFSHRHSPVLRHCGHAPRHHRTCSRAYPCHSHPSR